MTCPYPRRNCHIKLSCHAVSDLHGRYRFQVFPSHCWIEAVRCTASLRFIASLKEEEPQQLVSSSSQRSSAVSEASRAVSSPASAPSVPLSARKAFLRGISCVDAPHQADPSMGELCQPPMGEFCQDGRGQSAGSKIDLTLESLLVFQRSAESIALGHPQERKSLSGRSLFVDTLNFDYHLFGIFGVAVFVFFYIALPATLLYMNGCIVKESGQTTMEPKGNF